METKRVIKFTVGKDVERPKQLNKRGTLFGLLISERLKLQAGETKMVLLNFKVYIPKDIFAIIVLLPSFKRFGLKRRSVHSRKY